MEEPPAKRARVMMSNNELFRHLPIEQRVTTPRFVVTGHNPDGKGRLVRVNEPRSDHHYLPGRLCGFKSEKKMKPGVGNEKVYKFFVDVLGFEGKFLGLDERSFTYLPEYVGGNTPYDVGELMVVREHGGIRLCKVEGVYAYGKVIEYSVRMVELKEVNGTDTIVGTEHKERKLHNDLFRPFYPGEEPWKAPSERERIEIPEVRLNTYVKIESPGHEHYHKTGLVTKFKRHGMCKVVLSPICHTVVHHYYLRFVS